MINHPLVIETCDLLLRSVTPSNKDLIFVFVRKRESVFKWWRLFWYAYVIRQLTSCHEVNPEDTLSLHMPCCIYVILVHVSSLAILIFVHSYQHLFYCHGVIVSCLEIRRVIKTNADNVSTTALGLVKFNLSDRVILSLSIVLTQCWMGVMHLGSFPVWWEFPLSRLTINAMYH